MKAIDIAFEKFMLSRTRTDDRDTFVAGWNHICFELEAEHRVVLEKAQAKARQCHEALLQADYALRNPEETDNVKYAMLLVRKAIDA